MNQQRFEEIEALVDSWDSQHDHREEIWADFFGLVNYVHSPVGCTLDAIVNFSETLKSTALELNLTLEEIGKWYHQKKSMCQEKDEDAEAIHPDHRTE